MHRSRPLLGILVGVLMLASSAAHSLLGWKQLALALAATNTPPELVTGLAVGWHFGGATMVAFACIVILLFTDLLRGRPTSVRPAVIIGVLYVAFGLGVILLTGFDPFYFVFIVPGALLLIASSGRGARARDPGAGAGRPPDPGHASSP